MPAPNDPPPKGLKVEIYKLANRLKSLMGARFQDQEQGFLAPEAIEEADKLIEDLRASGEGMITERLGAMAALWTQMRDMDDGPKRAELSQQVFTLAHEIKDMATMCGYELIAYFAESLRDYVGRTDMNLKAQIIIVQAHMDAMHLLHKQGFDKQAGPETEELKKMVKMAIDKYH